MGQITTTQNLVAIKEVRHVGQQIYNQSLSVWYKTKFGSQNLATKFGVFLDISSSVFKIRSETCRTEAQFCQNLYMIKKESLPDRPKFCWSMSAVRHLFWRLRLVSNIRRTSNIRSTPTLGNSQLEFSPTISLAKTSNTSRTPSFDYWVSIVDQMRRRPTWSELLPVRFWLTVDQRTNDSSSVSAVCETYCSNTCCEALWLNCNRISFNRSKNMTPSPPIPRSAAPYCLLSKYPYRQITKDFAMRHDENYVQ